MTKDSQTPDKERKKFKNSIYPALIWLVVIIVFAVGFIIFVNGGFSNKENVKNEPIDYQLIDGSWSLYKGYVNGQSLDRGLMFTLLNLDEFNINYTSDGFVRIEKIDKKGVSLNEVIEWKGIRNPENENEYYIYLDTSNGVEECMVFDAVNNSFMWFSGDYTYIFARFPHEINIEKEIIGTWKLDSALAGQVEYSAEEYLGKIEAKSLEYIFNEGGDLILRITASDGRTIDDKMTWQVLEHDDNFVYSIFIESLGTKASGTLKLYTSINELYSESSQANMMFRKVN